MLKKGAIIQFVQMDDFTGKEMRYQGEIIGYATAVRKMWPVECGEVVNPVYLVKREDPYGNLHHMVFPEEILFAKQEGDPEEKGHLLKYLRKNQAYKAGIRADKEKKRRENYFK